MTGSITDINVTPRQITGAVGKHKYTITFNKETRAWEWRAIIFLDYPLTGAHKSAELAEAAAKKAIAKFVKTHEDSK